MSRYMYTEEVNAGIDLLNAKGPTGWLNRINKDQLDMVEGGYCILGWVYGHFTDGLDALGLELDDSVSYGFCLPLKTSWEEYEYLKEAWLDALTPKENTGTEKGIEL